jgi:PEGA domain
MTNDLKGAITAHTLGHWSLVISLILIICPGCVRRRMTIRTNPPGAKVYVDENEIGTTPVSTNYTYYAARKITLIKDGYRTETIYERMLPPWYELPPLDFVSENLYPREIRDERVLDFQLVPQEVVPREKLLGRAENLRLNARQGILTPLLSNPKQLLEPPSTEPPISMPGEGLPENAPILYPTLNQE